MTVVFVFSRASAFSIRTSSFVHARNFLGFAFFAIAAPLVGNPARRLFTLDNMFAAQDELAVPSERTPELSPSNQWVAVDTIDLETTPVIILPALEVTSP
jgi:hypothetical protein